MAMLASADRRSQLDLNVGRRRMISVPAESLLRLPVRVSGSPRDLEDRQGTAPLARLEQQSLRTCGAYGNDIYT